LCFTKTRAYNAAFYLQENLQENLQAGGRSLDRVHRNKKFLSSKKVIIIKSPLNVVKVIREIVTKKIVRSGFAVAGQYPIDFVSAMKFGPTAKDLSKAQYENMKDSVGTLANTFRQRGVLTEADIDRWRRRCCPV
jgi:hypothetical protein